MTGETMFQLRLVLARNTREKADSFVTRQQAGEGAMRRLQHTTGCEEFKVEGDGVSSVFAGERHQTSSEWLDQPERKRCYIQQNGGKRIL
jgi:hypothetical protein